ncbi:hypothetical protein JCM11251_005203 [Rhodosporidiobolus azoricus]
MPILRSPLFTPSSSASNSSSISRSSSVNSRGSSSPAAHSSTPASYIISHPLAKRVHLVKVPVGQDGISQNAGLPLMGNEETRETTGMSERSSGWRDGRQMSEEQGREPLFQPRVKVVVTKPTDEGEGKSIRRSPPTKRKDRESTSELLDRQKRFSLFTMDTVAQLEQAEEGAVVMWMRELSVTPHDSLDELHATSTLDNMLPPGGALQEGPEEHEQEEDDLFAPFDPRASGQPASLGRSLDPAAVRLVASSSDPSLPALSSSSASHSTFTPLPFPPNPTPHAVRFASSSDPPSSSFDTLFRSVPRPASCIRPGHSRTPSTNLEYEFVPLTTPRTFENQHSGQGYAPPIEPAGRIAKLLKPHPVVRARKSFREKRATGMVQGPPTTPRKGKSAKSSGSSASRATEGGGKTRVSRQGKERDMRS